MNEDFLMELAALLVKYPVKATNTPAEVLAKHMAESLRLFEQALIARSGHLFYKPGQERAS